VRVDIRTIIRETAARYGALALALILSLGGKALLLAAHSVPFNADEAVVALMAKHILQGERPLFFYGQAYMGSLDAFLVAGGFAIFGSQVWVVRAVQALLFAGTMILWHRFCEEGFKSRRVANVAAVLLGIPPVLVTLYTTISLGGYGEALFLGSLCLLLALQIARGKTTAARWIGLGLSAGVGFWAFPLSLVLTIPACLAAVSTLRSRPPPLPGPSPSRGTCPPEAGVSREKGRGEGLGMRSLLRFALLCGGAALGALPWFIGWFQTGAVTLQELGGSALAGVVPGDWGTVLSTRVLNFFLFGASTLFGFRPSWEFRWLIPHLLPLVLIFDLAAVAHSIWDLKRRDAARPVRWMLAGSAILLLSVYLLTPFGGDPSGRYFLPLALAAAALTAEFVVWAEGRIGRLAALFILLPVVYCALGTADSAARNPPGITTQFDPVAQLDQRDLPAVIDFLRRNHETRGYTNYWVSFPLAFLSEEELIFTARLPYHEDLRYTPRDDRYGPYDDLVVEADRVAYITTKNPELDSLLESTFARLAVDYQVEQIGDFRIYYRLSRVVRPDEILPTRNQNPVPRLP
jgi:hypothetical protein